eukprot:CAMPEP_0184387474 /NCGR_PEP_ID=MMETSP0007-20130409/10768_1 /TAXON_ID=97485 /ORGANISM="Prymnesium parvum, Strain Texoma1" /LENGTH=180 /DNA_ID=CAMNT_0026735881 /DNA_START=235 /DNA_END=777 /DNA_ORIENTATION=-
MLLTTEFASSRPEPTMDVGEETSDRLEASDLLEEVFDNDRANFEPKLVDKLRDEKLCIFGTLKLPRFFFGWISPVSGGAGAFPLLDLPCIRKTLKLPRYFLGFVSSPLGGATSLPPNGMTSTSSSTSLAERRIEDERLSPTSRAMARYPSMMNWVTARILTTRCIRSLLSRSTSTLGSAA